MLRYLRLLRSFARVSLLGELAFRGNFLLKILVEVSWLALMAVFYDRLFDFAAVVAGWTKPQYFFFLGCYFVLESVLEAFFLGNFSEFAELVRSGNLDFVLLKPVDEQFLVSLRSVEWSSAPNALFGIILMSISAVQLDIGWQPDRFAAFAIGFVAAVALAYSFLLMLASTSVWLVRNQSLHELWWLFTSLMRYPREIFEHTWAAILGRLFTFVIPVLLATSVPASSMVRYLEPWHVLYLVAAAAALLWVSRRVFRRALRSYRSASS